MAIAFDAATGNKNNSTTSQTWSHTCSGSDRILFVGFITNNTIDRVTGVTYNSVSMTRIIGRTGGGSGYYMYLYYLINPDTGANTVNVTFSSNSLSWANSSSYTGAKQSSQPDASVGSSFSSVPWSQAITTVDDNCWVVAQLRLSSGSGTFDSPRQLRNDSTQSFMGDSNAVKTPAGSYTMSGSAAAGNTDDQIILASFSPAAGASGPANLKSLDTNTKSNIKSYNTNLIANVKSINTNA